VTLKELCGVAMQEFSPQVDTKQSFAYLSKLIRIIIKGRSTQNKLKESESS
jgi:hypothetical protein